MYSWYEGQVGMKVKEDAIVDDRELLEIGDRMIMLEEIGNERFFNFAEMNDIKLYGYFYKETMEMFKWVANLIELTESDTDNYVEFTYEEGMRFRIGFRLVDGEPDMTLRTSLPMFSEPKSIWYISG